jgi:protein-L-isoaspartate(D-aspartate) O-methyltransferase
MTSPDYAAARLHMIESQFRPSGVSDLNVLKAFATTPREMFLPPKRRFLAYSDEPVEVLPGNGGKAARALMQPLILARLMQHAELRPGQRVLDVGAGPGYTAAILAKLGCVVFAVEDSPELLASARATLAELGLEGVTIVEGALAAGAPEHQPFHVILINGGIETEPEALLSQLAEGGRLYAVCGPEREASATVFLKAGGSISRRALFDAWARPLPGFEARPEFVF